MRPGAPQPCLEALSIGTAAPNTVYTQQAAKPECQEDTNAKFSHLLLAQLPRTQFTHSKAPNPHARKTPTQNFRTSYWHSYPEHSLHTARRQTRTPGRHHRNMFASPIGRATPNDVYTQQTHLHTASCQTLSRSSEYCACHTDRSRGPAATRRAATLSRASQYCACHTNRSRGPPATRRAATLSGGSKYCACHTDRSRGPAATKRAATLSIEAPNTAPATQTGAADQRRPGAILSRGSEYCARHTDRSRGPAATRRAATFSRDSEYCACHTDRSRGPAATRRAATLSRGSEYCACHTNTSRRPAATRRAATLSRGSEYCACHTDTSRGPAATRRAATLSIEASNTAPATQTGAADQRRPGAPQPFLEALR